MSLSALLQHWLSPSSFRHTPAFSTSTASRRGRHSQRAGGAASHACTLASQVKKMAEHDNFVNSCCVLRRGPPLIVSGSDDGTAKARRASDTISCAQMSCDLKQHMQQPPPRSGACDLLVDALTGLSVMAGMGPARQAVGADAAGEVPGLRRGILGRG